MNNESSESHQEIIPTKESLKNAAILVAGKGVAFLASFAAVTVLGRVVPREVVGSYSYVLAVFALISIFTLPGMNNALTRAIARGHEGNIHAVIKKRIVYGFIGSLVAAVYGIAKIIQGDPGIGIAFLVVTPFVALTDTFNATAFSYWQGKTRFDRSALLHTVYYCGISILSIGIFLTTHNLYGILAGVLSAQTLMGLLLFRTIQPENESVDPDCEKLGTHLTLMMILRSLASNADRIITWYVLGPVAVAVYSFAALPILKAWQLIPIGAISLPQLATQNLTQTVKTTIIKKTLMFTILLIPIVILLIFVSPSLYRIVFPFYPDSVIYFQILAIGIIFAPMLIITAALTAFRKTKILYSIETISPILRVIVLMGGGITFGLLGIAAGVVIGTALDFIFTITLFLTLRPEQ